MHYISTHPIASSLLILAIFVGAMKWTSWELKHAIPEPEQPIPDTTSKAGIEMYSIEKDKIEYSLDHHEEAISN